MQRGTCWIARPDPEVSIGTDHPFDMAPLDVPAAVDGIPGLTPEQKAWVYERTAKALLGEK